jgi:thiazole tautomerase (transcriptional regulator TenI)
MMELHVISDRAQSQADLIRNWSSLHPWVDAFHLRLKDRSADEVWETANYLLQQTDLPSTSLVINTHIDVALKLNCGGVHLPEREKISPRTLCRLQNVMRVGRSVHSLEGAKQAETEGLDYIFVGHIFPSNSKPGLPPLGTEYLQEIVSQVKVPVIAVGGIGISNLTQIRQAGCAGIAVITALSHAPAPEKVAEEMKRRWNFAS